MKKIVLTFGLIAGGILSAMMVITLPFQDSLGSDMGAVVGYTTMVAAFLLIFFGVRSYRDNVAGGSLSFGRAFAVGALIVVVASLCYDVTWQVITSTKYGDEFMAKYTAHMIEKARASGKSEAVIEKQVADVQRFAELYKNRVVNFAITFLEPLPVGLIISLVAAGVLRRRPLGVAAATG